MKLTFPCRGSKQVYSSGTTRMYEWKYVYGAEEPGCNENKLNVTYVFSYGAAINQARFCFASPNEGYKPKSDDLIKLLPKRKVLFQLF